MKVVVDASIAVAWLANDPASAIAAPLLVAGQDLIAPDLLPVEATNALWKRVIRGETAMPTAEQLIAHFRAIGVALFPAGPLLKPALRMAVALNHPLYDCLYLALAEREGAALATADKRMSAAALRLSPALPTWRG